jgi:hypothetical protein
LRKGLYGWDAEAGNPEGKVKEDNSRATEENEKDGDE